MAPEDQLYQQLIGNIRNRQRPDVGPLYTKLSDITAKPVDLSPLKAVAAANREGAQRDFLGGMAMSALGGKTMRQPGLELSRSGMEAGKPFRPNAADVGYENTETGEMVVNPLIQQGQEVKATEAQIKGVEAAGAKEDQRIADLIKAYTLSSDKKEKNALLMQIASMADATRRLGIEAGDERARRAADAKAAKAGEMPAAMQKMYIENKVGQASAEEAIKSVLARPDAFGLQNALPEEVLSRLDPEGVVARGTVHNLGSLKVHERSGAAVTAAEFPRLKPFIPLRTDNAKVTEDKVRGFKREYDRVVTLLEQGWPASALISNLDTKPGAKPPVVPPPAAGKRVEIAPGVFITEKP